MPGPVIDIEVDGKGGGGGSRQRLGCGGIVLGLFLLLVFARTVTTAILDYQWWNEVGQLETWWKQMYVHTAPIIYATAFGYVVLWIVHARALKAAGSSVTRYAWYARVSSLALLPLAWVLAAAQFSSWDVATWLGSRNLNPTSDWRDPVFGNRRFRGTQAWN